MSTSETGSGASARLSMLRAPNFEALSFGDEKSEFTCKKKFSFDFIVFLKRFDTENYEHRLSWQHFVQKDTYFLFETIKDEAKSSRANS